ncbi:sigma-70 family RNA polymerase sigma factor [Candidatus Poribacteria bacterium]|nr:sigma-70 family RNA polymerase sigma factor [Candidatus Poribacteria bacterium]MYG06839.1 sigma-70 family RNA polymerase sigma factor [Candidatus Poribacteria bacterium]MYK20953.1 sigma-70 family RNA polymerase sigma factor [Candidatus Poribacteria bacterium]
MTLKCKLAGIKCPPYKHQGVFYPDDDTVKSLLPDLEHCAACMAYTPPQRPDLQDDLLQVASLTLVEKGPAFNPTHESGANFRSFIRVHICGALTNAKKREVRYSDRETLESDEEWDTDGTSDASRNPKIGLLLEVPDRYAEFEDELVRDISFASALPELLQTLTPRERKVFDCIRKNQLNCQIAEELKISRARVSQLVAQITLKLSRAAQRLGLAE